MTVRNSTRPGGPEKLAAQRGNSPEKFGSGWGMLVKTDMASCQLHGLDPWAYLRYLFCLLRTWPPDRILELAPAFWKQTIQQQDTQHARYRGTSRSSPCRHHAS